jgi:DNA-binding MarR family transcriptional regulator
MESIKGYCRLCVKYKSIYEIKVNLGSIVKESIFVCSDCVKMDKIKLYAEDHTNYVDGVYWERPEKKIKIITLQKINSKYFFKILKKLFYCGKHLTLKQMNKNIGLNYDHMLRIATRLEKANILIKGRNKKILYYKINPKLKSFSEVINYLDIQDSPEDIQRRIKYILKNSPEKLKFNDLSSSINVKKSSMYYNLSILLEKGEICREDSYYFIQKADQGENNQL